MFLAAVVYIVRYIRYEHRIIRGHCPDGAGLGRHVDERAPFIPINRSTITAMLLATTLAVVSLLATTAPALDSHLVHFGGQGVNLLKIRDQQRQRRSSSQGLLLQQTSDIYTPPTSLEEKYPAQYFEQPLDHFDVSVNQSFRQRYWVDDRFYRAGGPVIVLDGGETSGANRLPFLDHGILAM